MTLSVWHVCVSKWHLGWIRVYERWKFFWKISKFSGNTNFDIEKMGRKMTARKVMYVAAVQIGLTGKASFKRNFWKIGNFSFVIHFIQKTIFVGSSCFTVLCRKCLSHDFHKQEIFNEYFSSIIPDFPSKWIIQT